MHTAQTYGFQIMLPAPVKSNAITTQCN